MWDELAELMLDIEIQINRRPLSYVEDDLELPTLTPATFLYQHLSFLPVEETWRIESNDLRKHASTFLVVNTTCGRVGSGSILQCCETQHASREKQIPPSWRRGDKYKVTAKIEEHGRWQWLQKLIWGEMEF